MKKEFLRLKKVIEFIFSISHPGIQVFVTENIRNDTMDFVKNIDGVDVWFCERFNYFEVLGLSCEEAKKLKEIESDLEELPKEALTRF